MNKQKIAVIKCPNCGSVNNTKLTNRLHHCEDCNADYPLNYDDKEVSINNNLQLKKSVLGTLNISKNKTSALIISVVVVVLFVAMIINSLISKSTAQQSSVPSRKPVSHLPLVIATFQPDKSFELVYGVATTNVIDDNSFHTLVNNE